MSAALLASDTGMPASIALGVHNYAAYAVAADVSMPVALAQGLYPDPGVPLPERSHSFG